MRRNEVLSLTRASIDWTNGIANLEKTKNGDSRHVPLNGAPLEALRSLPVRLDGNGKLFPFKTQPDQRRIPARRAPRRHPELAAAPGDASPQVSGRF
jgi:integrase